MKTSHAIEAMHEPRRSTGRVRMSARNFSPQLRRLEIVKRADFGQVYEASRPSCHMVAEDADLIAQLLGLTPRQLSVELDGQSVAHVARAHGIAPPYILDALLARCLRRIAAAVDSGRISPESAIDAY